MIFGTFGNCFFVVVEIEALISTGAVSGPLSDSLSQIVDNFLKLLGSFRYFGIFGTFDVKSLGASDLMFDSSACDFVTSACVFGAFELALILLSL